MRAELAADAVALLGGRRVSRKCRQCLGFVCEGSCRCAGYVAIQTDLADTKKPAQGGLCKSSRWPALVSGLQGLSGLPQNSFVLSCFTRHKGWISARRSF